MSQELTKVRCYHCNHKFYVNSGGAKAFRFYCPKCDKALKVGHADSSSSHPSPAAGSTPVPTSKPSSAPSTPAPAPPPQAPLPPPNPPFPSAPGYTPPRPLPTKPPRRRKRKYRTYEEPPKPMPTWMKFLLIYIIGQLCMAPFILVFVLLLFLFGAIGEDVVETTDPDPAPPTEYETDFDSMRRSSPLLPRD